MVEGLKSHIKNPKELAFKRGEEILERGFAPLKGIFTITSYLLASELASVW